MLFGRKDIVRLFWPVLVEQTFAVIIGMLAPMMVSGLGDAAVAGVGLTSSINFILMTTFTSVATGVTVVVAQRNGARAYAEAGEVAAQSITLVAYIGVILGAVILLFSRVLLTTLFPGASEDVLSWANLYLQFSCYSLPFQAIFSTIAGIMRASGNPKTPMIGSVMSNAFHLGVSLLTIYVFSMGVAGAGCGLIASRLAPAVFLVIMLKKGGDQIFLPRLSPLLNMKVLKPVIHIAVPSGIDSLIFNGGKLVVQVFMSGMGTHVLSANTIGSALCNVISLPGSSLQIVSISVVGRAFGARLYQEAKRHMLKFTLWSSLSEAVICLACWPLLKWLIALYQPALAVSALTYELMLMALIATPLLWSTAFVLPNGMRALGDAPYIMWVSVASMFLLRVFGSWFLAVHLGWGLWGIWLSMVIDWGCRSVLFLPRALRWKPPASSEPVAEPSASS